MKNSYNKETDTIIYKDHKIENFFKDFPQQNYIKDYVKDNLIFLCVGGSHAYGLDTESSDLDIRGIFKDNINQILGYEKIDQLENNSKDIVIYSLTKAIHLISEQNPNMQELLHIDEEEILYATEEYWYLRSQRDLLLSKLAKHKYSGYAISQLKRIKGHNKWLNKEQEGKFEKKPNIIDYITYIGNQTGEVYRIIELWDKCNFELDESYYFTKIKDELYNVWQDVDYSNFPLIENGNSFIPIQETHLGSSEYYGVIWFNKSQFQKDLEEYNNWKKWKENRNETRHELEEKYNFDTKHAMHTIRLLRMGCEILNEEAVKVKRSDRDFLLDIRNGKYSYEYIVAEAERLEKNELENYYKNSKLQNSVDKAKVISIIKKVLGL